MSEQYLVLCFPLFFPLEKRGGGRGFFSGQGNVPFQFYDFSRIYLVPCSVTPYLNQVFRPCFSMENLRAYVDDGSPSPSVQTTVTTRSSTSKGLSTSSSSSTKSSSVPSTRPSSGPVQDVVTSPAVVPTDKTVSLKDLPPPPPPDEPYELFLARVACQSEDASGGSRRPAAVGPVPPPQQPSTVGIRLPTPFPRFEDTAWASLPSVQGPRIRMPLPASCYVPPPQPWTWSGRGPHVPALQVRSPAPLLSSTDPIRFPGPSMVTDGPPATGPPSSTHLTTSSSVLKDAVPPPPRFRGFFQGATPPFIQQADTGSIPTAALQLTPQPGETVPQAPPPAVVQQWKTQIFEDMQLYWRQLQGDAPPQSTVSPTVTQGNVGSDALRQLSPSGDREASRAQHKSGSKRAGSTSRRRSSSRERSPSDRARRRDRRSRMSPDSSPSRRRSPAAYRSHPDRAGSKDSSSSEGRLRSQRSPRPWTSRSRGHRRRNSSPSTSPTRRFRSSPAPSRRPFGAGTTKRLAGRPSPSPPRRSHSHRQSRHPSRDSSPPTSRFRGRHHISSSSSRSPSPKRPRTERENHSHRDSRSLSQECGTHPYDSDIRLLRLRADSEEDRHIPSSHPRGSPEPAQSIGEDDSLSAAKVQKLFADLAAPPALSHYADPIPDSTATTQLVPYVRQSTTSSSSVQHSKPLETHGIFRNYQSFHRLSGDNEKEARTAAYYDLTSLMISQTDEPPLINVSSARPKMEDPFPHGAVSTNEMKKKSEKMILQWPPQSSHNKVIDRTLGLYQHGPPPKAGTNEKWPPPTVKNPWDKSFVPKEFPITHKIPSTMPKRWDLHSSSPLMLRPPLSTPVPEVPDAAISKSSSWLEAFAARAAHTATMSATSIISVYNFQQKVLEFLRDSVAKNNIQNDISVIDDLFQRANSMALEGHIMAHDSGVTATELYTHLHMLRRRSVLEDPSVSLPQRDKDKLLVMEVGGQDLFGPNARQVHEWKKDTEEENVKLIARVFDERTQRDKSKKKPASSESRPPRSMDHRSPLAGLSRPKPKDSYSQKPGQSFRRQPKQSPYKTHSGNQARTQPYNRDRPNASSAPTRNDSREQGQRRPDKDSKGPSSNRPFNRRGRGRGSGQGRK